MTAACALILAATLSSHPTDTGSGDAVSQLAAPIAAAVAAAPALEPAIVEPWMLDRQASRPAAISVLYGTLGTLQALDIYSTRRALNRGASEINPLLTNAAGNQAAMVAVKAISTTASIYFAERAWKKNRKGAIVMMALVNGVTAAVVARNLRNAR